MALNEAKNVDFVANWVRGLTKMWPWLGTNDSNFWPYGLGVHVCEVLG